MIKLAPSVLSADFARLAEDVRTVESSGVVDRIHVDVMDGMFVPNLTIGPLVVEALRPHTKLPLEAHLMIVAPDRYVKQFVTAGSDIVIVHYEACPHLHRDVQFIKELGAKAGVAINPATPVANLVDILPDIDLVLVMSVNPGFGGQRFIPSALGKIAQLRQLREALGAHAEIEVDGGVNAELTPLLVSAGAEVLVAGSAVFRHPLGPVVAAKELVSAGQVTSGTIGEKPR